ncbi:MAG: hypothetical protein AAFV07_03835, partial [Bacteroidota bacterium]
MFWIPFSSVGKCLGGSLLLLLCWGNIVAQGLSINTSGTSPDPSAMLDVSSTTQGFLMPRLTRFQRINIASPADGLMVFDTDRGSPYTYRGGQWMQLAPIPAGSIISRTDRQDALMASAGFDYFTEQLIPNGINTLEWQVPAPSSAGAAAAQVSPVVAWTGSEMLVWGGSDGNIFLPAGGRYSPNTDTWTTISTVNAPTDPRFGWTSSGDGFYVFGGDFVGSAIGVGYIYDFSTDTWDFMSQGANIPSPRAEP